MRSASLLAIALLAASCASPGARPPRSAAEAIRSEAIAPVCRVGPDGGPVLTDRGIGGTGAASKGPQWSDRGIGGTGGASQPTRSADRGIGGTGIIGIITGFASVCLDGVEVHLDAVTPVYVNGNPETAQRLRAGQLAAITADGPADSLSARRITVRHEVSGPVEAVADGGAVLVVAGQRVILSQPVWGEAKPRKGDWLAVSGLVKPEGIIAATRLDRRGPGRVTVHGQVTSIGDQLRIGALELRLTPGLVVENGQYVAASGRYAAGSLVADAVIPDLLATDPASYFGEDVSRFLIEAYPSVGAGQVRLSDGLKAVAAPDFGAAGEPSRPAVVALERRPDGTLLATGLHTGGGAGGPVSAPDVSGASGHAPPFGPAPPAGVGARQDMPPPPLAPVPSPTWSPAPVPNTSPAPGIGMGPSPAPGFGTNPGGPAAIPPQSPVPGGFGGAPGAFQRGPGGGPRR